MSTITLITGANQGIGLATAKQLAKDHGHHVIIGSRDAIAGANAAASIREDGLQASNVQLDITSQDSIDNAADAITKQFGRLDVLINNAGILIDLRTNETFRNIITQTMNTNVIGTACTTEAMIPLLRKSAFPRVVFVSSRMGSLAQSTVRDTNFYAIDYKTYDASKAAVNMLALNYSRILEDTGARVNIACPGYVATKLTGYTQYGRTPEDGAKRIVELATIGKDGPIETFSDSNGTIPW